MIELNKKAVDQVTGGNFFVIPTSCMISMAFYVSAKFLFTDEPLTDEGLMASAFFGLIFEDALFNG